MVCADQRYTTAVLAQRGTHLLATCWPPAGHMPRPRPCLPQVAEEDSGELPPADLRSAVAGVHAMASFIHTRTTKGSRKRSEDIRAQLLHVEMCRRPFDTPLAEAAPAVLGTVVLEATTAGAAWGVVRYVSGKKEDNGVLPAERVVEMLNAAAGCRCAVPAGQQAAVSLLGWGAAVPVPEAGALSCMVTEGVHRRWQLCAVKLLACRHCAAECCSLAAMSPGCASLSSQLLRHVHSSNLPYAVVPVTWCPAWCSAGA